MAKSMNYLASSLVAFALSTASCSFKPTFTTTMTSFAPAPSSTLLTNKITLEQARKNPSLRQVYLDKVISPSKSFKDCEIQYDLSGEHTKDETLAVTRGITCEGKLKGFIIFVGKTSFDSPELIQKDEDFKYLIECHEYRHVIQYAQGIGKFSGEEIYNAARDSKLELSVMNESLELEAANYGIKQISKGNFNINPYYLECQKRAHSKHLKKVMQFANKSSGFQKEFITEVLKQLKNQSIK